MPDRDDCELAERLMPRTSQAIREREQRLQRALGRLEARVGGALDRLAARVDAMGSGRVDD